METWIVESAKQVPALVVLGWIVKLFLNNSKEGRAASREAMERGLLHVERVVGTTEEIIKNLGNKIERTQNESIKATTKNTEVLSELRKEIEEMNHRRKKKTS